MLAFFYVHFSNNVWPIVSVQQMFFMCITDHSAAARLAQSVEHETLNLGVVGSSPTLGLDFHFIFYSVVCVLFCFSIIIIIQPSMSMV